VRDELDEVLARLRSVKGPPDDVAVPFGSFMRGLALGALVGAAIAGSTVWNRRRGSRAKALRPSNVPEAPPPREPGGFPTS
jgi:hypothetical protein